MNTDRLRKYNYYDDCIEYFGGVIFRNKFNNKGENIITITLECMDSEENLNKYCYIYNGIDKIEEYFKRNKYQVTRIEENREKVVFIVNKNIKKWDTVYKNIINIMKKETKFLNVLIWKLNF